jgi:nicotinate-nucleotide adenylyltransferase
MDLILFGGSFDPLHIGHVQTVSSLLKNFKKAKILMLPGQNRFKMESTIPLGIRIECAKTVFKSNPQVEILDWSLDSDTSSTYEVYSRIVKLNPDKKVWVCAGEDILESLIKWNKFDQLKSEVNWIFLKRYDGRTIRDLQNRELIDLVNRSLILENNCIEVSSSSLRSKLMKLEDFIPPEILDTVRIYLK